MYRDLILKHAREPRRHGLLENPDLSARAVNRLCGDELELTLAMDGVVIREAWVRARGCAMLQASGSMMTEFIETKTLAESIEWGEVFRTLLLETEREPPPDFGKLASLLTMRPYRARHKCVLLPWMALADCAHPGEKGSSN